MPARQRGEVFRRGTTWTVRFYDHAGRRRWRGGFETKTSAREWLDRQVDDVQALRLGEPARGRGQGDPRTVQELVELFLELHDVDDTTKRKMRSQLKRALAQFGDRDYTSLRHLELERWRQSISPGNRHYVFRAFRQVLEQAVRWQLTDINPAGRVRNPKPKRSERRPITPFESWGQVELVAAALDPRFAAIPIFGVGTGLRPEEWIALERRDVDRERRVVHVRRVYTQGRLREGDAKTKLSIRTVPLTARVLAALDEAPRRIDSQLLFPAARGGYIDLESFRFREWKPALFEAGIEHRRIYDMRHTYASFGIAGEVELFHLARVMGTSVAQIDDTYGHLLPGWEDHVRAKLEAADAGFGQRTGSSLSD